MSNPRKCVPYSMLIDQTLYKQLNKTAEKLRVSKRILVEEAIKNLLSTKDLRIEIR